MDVPKLAARPVSGDDTKALVYSATSEAHVYVAMPEGGGEGGPIAAEDITDASEVGQAVLTAEDAEAARAAIGAAAEGEGGSAEISTDSGNQVVLGTDDGIFVAAPDLSGYATTTALTMGLGAKADTSSLHEVATSGDYADLDNKPSIPSNPGDVGAAAASHGHTASQITNSGATGRSLVQAANPAAARSTLDLGGAATLDVGTTAGTVKAGDWLPGISQDEDNQATLGSDDLVFVPEPNLAGLPYLASSWLPGIEDLPSGSTVVVWFDTEWPARPTARMDIFIRWCSVGDQGTPPGALARDFVEVYEESAPAFPGTVLSSYTFEGDSNGNPISPSSPWSQSGGGSTPFTASTAAAIHGSLGGRISEATQNRMLEHTSGSTHTNTRVVDVYIIPRAVSANSAFAAIRDLGASTTRGDIRINTDRTVTIRNGAAATATSTTVLALDTTYRIAWKTTASEGQSARIYNATGDLIETISGALSGNTHNNIRVGLIVASSGYSADYDSIRIGDDWLAPHA